MANVKLSFLGTEKSGTNGTELQCYVNQFDEIFISIESEDYPASYICIDVSTAIKFSKTLRTEINKAKEVCDE